MVNWQILLYATLGLNLFATVFSSFKVLSSLKKFQLEQSSSELSKDTPSVSVCIPARNESHAMTQCLEKVLASNYPKIEIIVCDDDSVDETSILIKSFAHAGVRFVESKITDEAWLGRNHALDRLIKEASGTYVLFMDVDNNLKTDTITKLTQHLEAKEATMMSVLPPRFDSYRMSAVFGGLRNYWELIKYSKNNPPISSSAWMIKRTDFLNDFGGFENYKNAIQPESIFAKKYSKESKYNFLISSNRLGLGYEKRWSSQVETSIRQLYPLAENSLSKITLYLLGLLVLNAPNLALLVGIIDLNYNLIYSVVTLHLVPVYTYAVYLKLTRGKNWFLASLVWPYLIMQELILFVISILAYKTGKVAWKGRSISVKSGANL